MSAGDFMPPPGGKCRECGAPVEFGWTCAACFERDDRRTRVARVKDRVDAFMRSLPPWQWAQVGNPLFAERVGVPRFRSFAEKFTPSRGDVLLSGPSGSGKTAAMRAAAARLALTAIAAADERAAICSALWTDGHALVRAVREHRLGAGPCPEALAASNASVLFLDEIGQEPRSEVFFEVIDARYQRGLPTLVTSGLRLDELRQRYGEALTRRLVERGTVLQGWPGA